MFFNKKTRTGELPTVTTDWRHGFANKLIYECLLFYAAKRTKVKKKADQLVGAEDQGDDQDDKVGLRWPLPALQEVYVLRLFIYQDNEDRRSGDEEEEEQDAFDDEEVSSEPSSLDVDVWTRRLNR